MVCVCILYVDFFAEALRAYKLNEQNKSWHTSTRNDVATSAAAGTAQVVVIEQAGAEAKASAETRRQEVMSFISGNRNQRTAATYASGWKRFQAYLKRLEVKERATTEVEVAAFLQERWQKDGVKASTLHADKAAIADGLKAYRNEAAAGRMVANMMAVLATKADPSTSKKHMSVELMRDILQSLNIGKNIDANGSIKEAESSSVDVKSAFLAQRNICLLLFMLLGMLRSSEAVALVEEDVVLSTETVAGVERKVLSLFIRRSKVDQERKGEEVRLGENQDDPLACPVSAYVHSRALKISLKLNNPKQPFFGQTDGRPLASGTPNHIVKNAVADANTRWEQRTGVSQHFGSQDEYGSHSLRRGGVTLARDSGVSMLDIQRHGRWKSLTVFDYVGRTMKQQLSVTASLLEVKLTSMVAVDSDSVLVEANDQGERLERAAAAAVAPVTNRCGLQVTGVHQTNQVESRSAVAKENGESDAEELDEDVFVPKGDGAEFGSKEVSKSSKGRRGGIGSRGPYKLKAHNVKSTTQASGQRREMKLNIVKVVQRTSASATTNTAEQAKSAAAAIPVSSATTPAKRRHEVAAGHHTVSHKTSVRFSRGGAKDDSDSEESDNTEDEMQEWLFMEQMNQGYQEEDRSPERKCKRRRSKY